MVARRKQHTAHILLVEDNPADARLIATLLGMWKSSFKLDVVTDGEQAINYLQRKGEFSDKPIPHLIILDLNLPRIDGREVLKATKVHEHLKRIPIIVLTTSNSEEDIATTYGLHANAFISKPEDLNDLTAIVQSIEAFWLQNVELPNLSRESIAP